MLVPPQVVVLEVSFTDRDAGVAEMSFRFPASLSFAELLASVDTLLIALAGISDAAITYYTLRWHHVEDEPDTPHMQSDTRRYLSLFYTNALVMFAFDVPSPKPELFVPFGPYAGIKLNLRNETVAGLVDSLTQALELTVNPDGSERNPVIVSGGKTI